MSEGIDAATGKVLGKAVEAMLSIITPKTNAAVIEEWAALVSKGKLDAARHAVEDEVNDLVKECSYTIATDLMQGARPTFHNQGWFHALEADTRLRSNDGRADAILSLRALAELEARHPLVRLLAALTAEDHVAKVILASYLGSTPNCPYPAVFERHADLIRNENLELAKAHYARALALSPDNAPVHRALRDIYRSENNSIAECVHVDALALLGADN